MQDFELIKKIQAGDFQAFKQLFEQYKDSIFNLCFRFVKTNEEAEDLCQEVFLKIYSAVNTFKFQSKLSTWIYRITINLCLNYKRKHHKTDWLRLDFLNNKHDNASFSNEQLQTTDLPDQQMEHQERDNIVQNAINRLPKNQQAVLILQRYQNLSLQEIAEYMDCSMSAVQSRLTRAKQNLCKLLRPLLKEI